MPESTFNLAFAHNIEHGFENPMSVTNLDTSVAPAGRGGGAPGGRSGVSGFRLVMDFF